MSIIPTASSFITKDGRKSAAGGGDLGQADFLRLMMEQLKNQDPLKPLDSNQFLGQLAQFSTVQGIQGLQQAFNGFASAQIDDQALQAAGLIGRHALVSSNSFQLGAEPVSGALYTPSNGTVSLEITNAGGEVVRRMTVEADRPGELPFEWDGVTDDGQQAPPGIYRINARVGQGNSAVAVETQINTRIDSVSFGPSGLILNLAGGGSIPFSAVRRIG